MWAMFVVLVVVAVGHAVKEIVKEMPAALAGEDLDYQIGRIIGSGTVSAIVYMIVLAAILLVLVVGGVYYVTARKQEVTFREAVFNWPLVILAGLFAFSSLL
jgi:hypothetical protein